ncbi:hypothetical protein MKZ38_004225 [Zalerion maritima]|uniref:Adenosine deaminase domain-containing protein n=1 Tax=Zalerion maritima TaxID=339359 RepID=A0AAD5RSX6_9PEZI|nr:hypothetical protein MKZ38_004225 [Zalerion maritima]
MAIGHPPRTSTKPDIRKQQRIPHFKGASKLKPLMPFSHRLMGSKESKESKGAAAEEEKGSPTQTNHEPTLSNANGHAKLKKAEPSAPPLAKQHQHPPQTSRTRRFLKSLRSRDSPALRQQYQSSSSPPPSPQAPIPQQPSSLPQSPQSPAADMNPNQSHPSELVHPIPEAGTEPPEWKRLREECNSVFANDDVESDGIRLNDEATKARRELVEKEDKLFNPVMKSENGWTDADREREDEAAKVLEAMKIWDRQDIAKLNPLTGYKDQKHPRFVGDHFLTNLNWINSNSKVFKVAKKMPKGAHLHVHFNACLPESFLLDLAMQKEQLKYMYIRTKVPLTSPEAFQEREIQFQMMPDGDALVREYNSLRVKLVEGDEQQKEEAKRTSNNYIWGPSYNSEPDKKVFPPYKFVDFLDQFDAMYKAVHGGVDYELENHEREEHREKGLPDSWAKARKWLLKKLVFEEEEAHNKCQTIMGVWENFDCRTRMMKGLFSYETAYKEYIDALLKHFVGDGIQYAEIRPNFMKTNQLFKVGDGGKQFTMNNFAIMNLIVDRFEAFQKSSNNALMGLKIIYCVPRSFPNDLVNWGLEECIIFKKIWPQYMAAFDLIGPEFRGRPLKDFTPQFSQFRARCAKLELEIPFAFHCGETFEWGGNTDGNLFDAVSLGEDSVKRIGHGGALVNHPEILKKFLERNVCVEVCSISNEQLGLTPRIGSHPVYALLANGVHCAISGDNGTLFRSTLSHDMYQVQVGAPKMRLQAWRQLVEWSLEHAILSDEERKTMIPQWMGRWRRFLDEVLAMSGEVEGELKEVNGIKKE